MQAMANDPAISRVVEPLREKRKLFLSSNYQNTLTLCKQCQNMWRFPTPFRLLRIKCIGCTHGTLGFLPRSSRTWNENKNRMRVYSQFSNMQRESLTWPFRCRWKVLRMWFNELIEKVQIKFYLSDG